MRTKCLFPFTTTGQKLNTILGLIFIGGILGTTNKKWLNDGNNYSRNFSQGFRVYSTKGISTTINSMGGGVGAKTGLYEFDNRDIRRLTPKECERLQGFPDDWTKYGLFEDGTVKEISDAQRYKCCGNAVTTNVIKDIVLKWSKVTNG